MTTGTAPAVVTTTEEFTQLWRTPPNFRLAPSLFQPEFAFPATLEVLDRLRHDEATKVTLLGQDPAVRTARALAFGGRHWTKSSHGRSGWCTST
jgi:hypothetical protein